MNSATRAWLAAAGPIAVVVAGAAASLTAGLPARQSQEQPVVCAFRNPSYTGQCEERAPYEKDKKLDAICKPILECLNDTRCIKTYCGATTIRQGWVLESATRAK